MTLVGGGPSLPGLVQPDGQKLSHGGVGEIADTAATQP